MADACREADHFAITMLIVDASVAVKFVLLEAGSDKALELLGSGVPLVAPDWMLLETAHAIWKFHGDGGITEASALHANEAMPRFFSRFYPASELLADAVRLSYRMAHDVYDCCYLALAMRDNATVMTADRKFWNAARRTDLAEHVRLLECA